ncbi:hypothetical protein WA026_022378 [Henosepilachna vigintioctopunctata]|uniref:ATP synthase F0 subunit 8 n=1 Tax=Henosepilachna vigintioctopunctata TaxID=420089 RepID=A0AAW1UCQ3_9CUCU
MNSFFAYYLNNTTLIDHLNLSWSCFCGYFFNTILFISNDQTSNISIITETLSDLKAYFYIVIVNFFLIFIAWKIYYKRITDQFMQPATSKAIEELKASVSKLKLPKEHSPRI